jgi:hypothetical protein
MSEQQEPIGAPENGLEPEDIVTLPDSDDDALDLIDEDDDLGDDLLDGEGPVVEQFDAEVFMRDAVEEAPMAQTDLALDQSASGLDGDDESLLDDDVFDTDVDLDAGAAMPALAVADSDARIDRLEKELAGLREVAQSREDRRLKRKVTAATTGAGASGFIPLLLQMLGVFDLDPEIIATVSAGASALGALVAGWATPERKPAIPS